MNDTSASRTNMSRFASIRLTVQALRSPSQLAFSEEIQMDLLAGLKEILARNKWAMANLRFPP